MKLILVLFAGCLLLSAFSEANSQDLSGYPVIPWPQHLEAREGTFAARLAHAGDPF